MSVKDSKNEEYFRNNVNPILEFINKVNRTEFFPSLVINFFL